MTDDEDDVMVHCVFPDCGCAEARLCMAEEGANSAALTWNLEKGPRPRGGWRLK